MNINKKTLRSLLSVLIVSSNIFFLGVNASAATIDESKTAGYNNNKGYVYNPELQIDLKVRSTSDINGYVETSPLVNTFLLDANLISLLFSIIGRHDKNNCSCLKLALRV